MKVIVQRIEIVMITNQRELLEEHEFPSWELAIAWLQGKLHQKLSAAQEEAIKAHPYTETSPDIEFVTKGHHGYTARVFYKIFEFKEGGQ